MFDYQQQNAYFPEESRQDEVYLCISVTFLDGRFHGRGDRGQSEWPPSPLRLFQAIIAANADKIDNDSVFENALRWLEKQSPPIIIAPQHAQCTPYYISVPNNDTDILAKAWCKGNYSGTGETDPAKHRTMKAIRPVKMVDGDTVHYLWQLREPKPADEIIQAISQASKRLFALGWGIDLAVGFSRCLTAQEVSQIPGERWKPTPYPTFQKTLRTPTNGTLDALKRRYRSFLNRISLRKRILTPPEPLSRFEITAYHRLNDPLGRPMAAFELRYDDGSFCRYPQRKITHIAGMVRHLAVKCMKQAPPEGVDDDWVERYVAGHRDKASQMHRQFSYIPLPSIGHPHADQAIRRVMIVAPPGDDRLLEHLARRINEQQLEPLNGNEFGPQGPPTLIRVYHDNVVWHYVSAANQWATVTPVILPGHDDRKPSKRRKLIETALAQAGIEQPCTYEWSPFSYWPKSYSAHKYDRDKKPTGYFRPDHLQTQTAVHLIIRFNNGVRVPGPLAIGAGRHCGFGIMAGINR